MNDKIICCGNTAFDLIAKGKCDIGNIIFHARPGGSVSNTALILKRLGLSVIFISKTGKDFLGTSLIKTLRNKGIDTRHILQDKNIKTSLAFAEIDKRGNSSYVFYKTIGPRLPIRKNEIPPSLLKKASVFHTGSLFSYNDYTHETVLNHIKQAKKKKVFTTYDPNWRGSRIKNKRIARSRIRAILPHIDLLKLSETDAFGITGARTLIQALNSIRKILEGDLVITQGRKGAFYWDRGKKISHPAFRVKVVDTIGAGDAFTAGLIYRYLKTGKETFQREKKKNIAFASAVSALVCTGEGSIGGLRSANQVKKFLSRRARI